MAGFDFFRTRRSGYVPRTPAGALKAVGTGTVPVEQFVYTSASVKPLDEQPYDLEAIERVLAKTGLTLETNLLLKGVLEKLIKSDDTETALFGAEGINALEARYVKRIEELRGKTEPALADAGGARRTHSSVSAVTRTLARQLFELSELHAQEKTIRSFYLRAAYSTLRNARGKGRISRRDLGLMVDILVALGAHNKATALLDRVKVKGDARVLLLDARVAFHKGDYTRVADRCRSLASASGTLGKAEKRIVAYWTASDG